MREFFYFNGVNLGRWMRANPRRSFTSKVSHETIDIPGKDGAYFVRTKREPLTISVDVRLIGTKTDHRVVGHDRHLIASALITNEPKRLILPDEPHLYYMAMLNNADELDTLWNTGGCTLEFIAYDPTAYGSEHMVSLSSGKNSVHIQGTVPAYPSFHLTSTGGIVKVIRDEGEYVKLSATAAKSATVEIDMQEQSARINTNLSAVDLESDYFSLDPGTHTITLENATGSLVYRERWV